MSLILSVKGVLPQFGNNCFIAPNATIAGDVAMGNDCIIWFNAVIRGDVNSIRMGDKVNVQDGAIIHCTYIVPVRKLSLFKCFSIKSNIRQNKGSQKKIFLFLIPDSDCCYSFLYRQCTMLPHYFLQKFF